MALHAVIEAELALIKDSGQREAARRVYEANPNLAKMVLNDKDYSRVIQEAAATKKQAEELKAEATRLKTEAEVQRNQNIKWYKESNNEFIGMKSEKERLEAELKATKEAMESAEAGGASAAEMLEYKREIAALKTDLTRSREDIEKRLDEKVSSQADGFGAFLLDIVEAKEKHFREFGSELPKDKIITFMRENKIATVDEAYNRMTAGDRQKKWETDKEKEIEQRLRTSMHLPMDTGDNGASTKGPLQTFIHKETGIPDGITADGSGRLAALAAAELRAEGKV